MINQYTIDLNNVSSWSKSKGMAIELLVAVGFMAGLVTTWVGLGGGIFMTLVLSILKGPALALATSAPALWLGNFHRLILFRQHVDYRAYAWIGSTALIGAVVGGVVATALPARVLQVLMVIATAAALLPRLPVARTVTRPWWTIPLGLLTGFTTSTSGAGGVFLSPAVLSLGIEGSRFVATTTLVALTMHTGRLIAYSSGGWVTRSTLQMSVVLGVSIMVGNFVGRSLRARTPDRVLGVALRAMMAVLAIIAVASLRQA